MIAPTNRLLLLAGLFGLPAAAFAAASPDAVSAALLLSVVLCIAAVVDAARCGGYVRGISAALPERVRMTKDRESSIEITLSHDNTRDTTVRIGLDLPAPLKGAEESLLASVPGHAPHAIVSWPCVPRKRGQYTLDRVYLECTSPLGLWRRRAARDTDCEVRVYPNLLHERGNLAGIFLRRGGVGVHAQRQIGKGRDFEQLREYISGDSYEDIHWKATARRGHPVTKMYQVERTQEIYVIVDASRLSARETFEPGEEARRTTQLERFITAALVMGLVAEKQGDLFGLISFSDQVHRFVRAKTGREHFNTCRDALYTLQPNLVNPDFEELCAFLRTRLRRRALLFFLTNLDDPVLAESFARNLELINRHHLILANMIAPPMVRPLFSDQGADSVDGVYSRLAGHIQWQQLREVQRSLHHRGVTMTLLENAALCPEMVSQYMSVKRRQAL